MLTKPQVFYDNVHKQALGYQNPFYLKKAQRIKPSLYDGSVISSQHVDMPVIDDDETLILEEVSRSKMLAKPNDPISEEKKVNTTPINYVEVNKLSEDFGKRFVPQQELSAEQAFWFHMSNPTTESSDASSVKVEAPSELPKVSLVNDSLKKLTFHLAKFDSVVKIRTTPDALTEVQTVFNQMEAAVQQCSVDKQCFEIVKKKLFLENDRLLQKIMSQDVLLSVMNTISLNGESVNMEMQRSESCDKCFNLDVELSKTQNVYNDLLKNVKHSLLNVNSELIFATCNQCMFDAIHDMCVLNFVKNVNGCSKSAKKHKKQTIWKPTSHVFTEVGFKWKPTGRTFTLVSNSCPLTRFTPTKVVPIKEATSNSVETSKLKLKVYSRRPKHLKNVGSSKKAKIVESKNANNLEPNHTWGSNATDIPSSSSLVNDRLSRLFSGIVRSRNDQIANIIGYGDYQLGNIIISRLYYFEGLGHNLFSVGKFCDADLEVTFWKDTCFIRNLDGVDLLSRSRDTNLCIISLDDMLKTSLICLLSKASKTKSWLWHHRLMHLNFGTLNKLAKDGKSKKSSHQPKAKDTNQEKLYLLHMDLCGLMRMESINEKKYILVIVDDYSRFTWVRFLRSKDEAFDAIIKCINNIQVRLNVTVRNVRTDNGTEFVNQTLHEFYENVGISHETSVARTPQQNDVVERRN
ncbi:retrovirus-related pol polyprotein from transposon TNT 1-94 [Tanacetum coccineum]